MAGITPSYRIGPSDFFTSGDLLADANTLNDQVNRLNDQFHSGTTVSDDLWNAWADFIQQWRGYYSDTFGGVFGGFFAAFNDSNRDQLIQFETRFQNFVIEYQDQTRTSVPDVVAVSSGTKDNIGEQLRNQLQPLVPSVNMTYVLIALVIGIVVYFAGKHFIKTRVMT
jgi:hypothetical protein